MDSINICQRLGAPVGGWQDLQQVDQIGPESRGVYVIRIAGAKRLGRLKGDSDLVYIGSGNIGKRLKAHADFRPDLKDKGWLLTWIACEKMLEVGFFLCDQPERVEADLLVDYLVAHLELPPANWKGPKLSDRHKTALTAEIGSSVLKCLPPTEQENELRKLRGSRRS